MAYLPQNQIDQILENPLPQWTPNSITDKDVLLQELQKIREQKVCQVGALVNIMCCIEE